LVRSGLEVATRLQIQQNASVASVRGGDVKNLIARMITYVFGARIFAE